MALEKNSISSDIPLKLISGKSGFAGIVLLLLAILWFLFEPAWQWQNSTLLFLGSALIIRFLVRNRRMLAAERRTRVGANVTVMLILIFALWAMTNYLSSRHYFRKDWTAMHKFQLADLSKMLVQDLNAPLKITTVFKSTALYREVDDLLQEYHSASRQVILTHVDPDKEPGQVQFMAERLGLQQLHNSSIIMEYEDRSRVIRRTDLITYEVVQDKTSSRPRRRALFNGEMALTSAIFEMLTDDKSVACFVIGHGEKDIDDYQKNGLSLLRDALRRESYVLRKVFLPGEQSIPADCDLLVIPGPQQAFSTFEAQIVERYLNTGGKLLILVDPLKKTGLESVLHKWGIRLIDDVIIEPEQKSSARDYFSLYVNQYFNHAITENIFRTATLFPSARSVKLHQVSGRRLETNYLLRTSPKSWGERNIQSQGVSYDLGEDTKGPLYVGAAVAEASSQYAADVLEKTARLVVFGDSDFATNAYIIKLGNEDLILNSISWLAKRENMIAIRAKSPDRRKLVLSAGQKKTIFWMSVIAIPSVGLMLGAVVWWRRRR